MQTVSIRAPRSAGYTCKVPEYRDPLPTVEGMNPDQKRFYDFWLSEWQFGNAPPLDRQVSYAFCYLYSVLGSSPEEVTSTLERMYAAYPDEGELSLYVRLWLSDCYVMERRYVEALEVFPEVAVGARANYLTEKRLNIKLLAGDRISGSEALALAGPRLKLHGRITLQELSEYLDIQLRALEAEKRVNLLQVWSCDAYKTRYEVFTGYLGAIKIALPFYHFSSHESAVQEICSLILEAESTLMEERDSSRIGEVWVAEIELYGKLKKFFSREPVLYHARPYWLTRQHLDVLLPKRGVAIEYRIVQQNQADELSDEKMPIGDNDQGDAEKRNLCADHGIRVVEVGPGYNFDSVVSEIIKSN